jgi:N-acylneuraminate cytidylyltransferase/CMP-N,N'-diacetyllegionaminic acid synthase
MLHAMDWIETNEGRCYDAIMLLEPAAPFARAADYDNAVAVFGAEDANLVVGVREMEIASHFVGTMRPNGSIEDIVSKFSNLGSIRRQDQAPEFTPNGALYLTRWDWFKTSRHLYADPKRSFGVVMDRFHSIEIDSPIDLAFAEMLVERGVLDMNDWRDAS